MAGWGRKLENRTVGYSEFLGAELWWNLRGETYTASGKVWPLQNLFPPVNTKDYIVSSRRQFFMTIGHKNSEVY